MSVLDKFKIRKDLKEKLKQEEESRTGGKKKDPRLLPYYDMKFGEKVKVVIVPDSNGNLWHRYSAHGPNMGIRGIKSVGCRRNNDQEDCPICQRGFDLLQEAKKTDSKVLKDEAKRWFPKDTTIMSVLVLESPFEVPIGDDGNEVKLMYVPYAIEALIKNALAEGQIDEDSILTTPLWIKKSIKKGTKDTPDYSASYFDYRAQLSDDEIEAFDGAVIEPYTYATIDLVPASPSIEEAEEWLDDTMERDAKMKKQSSKDDDGDDDSDKTTKNTSGKLKSVADRLKERKAASEEEDEPDDEPEDEPEEESEPEPEKNDTPKTRAQMLKERLAKNRN